MNMSALQRPSVRTVLVVLFGAIVLLIVFKMGEVYGYAKAGFFSRAGEGFRAAYVDPRGGPHEGFTDGFLPAGHGAAGRVVSVAPPDIVIEGPDNVEKVVTTDSSTLIRRFRDEASLGDIAVGASVVIIGEPGTDGKILAKLIRLMPEATSTAP